MKLIKNTIICLIIVFASSLLNISTVFAQDEKQPITVEGTTSTDQTIVSVDSAKPYESDTVYTQN